MKIGITCYPTFGGSGVVATELGLALARHGDEVHFISYAMPSRLNVLHERIHFHEVNVTPYPLFDPYPPYTLALATKMAEVASYEKLEVLHVHYAIPHATSAHLAKQILRSNLKVITTLHGTDITLVGRDESYLPITKFGIEVSDGVTAVSQWLKQETANNFHTDKAIEVIPNFVDPKRFRRDSAICNMFASPGDRLVCHVSNFRPVKRPVECVEILARVREKGVGARLVMVGDGSERSRAEHRARCLNVERYCSFVGKQPRITDYLSVADVLLLPSEQESFGLAALEALACEVPVVASRVGGVPEVVDDGATGYLSEAGDVEKMSDDAARLLSDEEARREMGRRAREAAVSRYSTDLVIPQYIEFYERVIAETKERASGFELRVSG